MPPSVTATITNSSEAAAVTGASSIVQAAMVAKAGGSEVKKKAADVSTKVKKSAGAVKEKAGKKRKAAASEEPKKKVKAKKVEKEEAKEEKKSEAVNGDEGAAAVKAENGVVEEEGNPLALKNFRISKPICDKLVAKGIDALFPIQARTFDIAFEGNDLVGRARTGQGKTLAFVLPVLEKLLMDKSRLAYGRAPRVIVLVPTRELAKQVGSDFEALGNAVGLVTLCVYGGAPMSPQEVTLRRGVDIVVGTPGRIKDLLQRGSLNLKTLIVRVLDEADEMLNMGFVDDVETILGAVDDVTKVQTFLFSATMPVWVKQIADRFLKPEKQTVDLVGDEKMKASANVKHMVLPCHWTQRNKLVPDLISRYGSNGRVIVFTETKNDASELAQILSHLSARALHGDIPQAQREVTLAGFRSGKFMVLVATDVAARGLDINDVQLVIQVEPPKTEETYIHRSGRTGRAGNTGVSVMLAPAKKEYMVAIIERKAGLKFERISPPQPADIAKASATSAIEAIQAVDASAVSLFTEAAEELIRTSASPTEALAKAIAKISGHTSISSRSLLSSHDDCITLSFKAETSVRTPTYVFTCLRKFLPEDSVSLVRRMTLTADGKGAVFDVPAENAKEFVRACEEEAKSAPSHFTKVTLEIATCLPELQTRIETRSSGGMSNGHSGGRGSGGFRGRSSYSGGGNRGGGGGFRSRGRGRG